MMMASYLLLGRVGCRFAAARRVFQAFAFNSIVFVQLILIQHSANLSFCVGPDIPHFLAARTRGKRGVCLHRFPLRFLIFMNLAELDLLVVA